jgi:hypothetical protein
MSVAQPHPSARMTVGSFVPAIWLGRAARGGLAFLGDSDQGWVPSDQTPAFQVIRRENAAATDFVLNLVSEPFTLARPRTLVFALAGTPVKPLAPDFRKTLTGVGNTYTFTGGQGSYSHLVPPYQGSFYHDTGWDGTCVPGGERVNSPFPADWDLNRYFNLELAKAGGIYLPYQTLNYTHLERPLDPRTQGLEGPELWHVIGPEIHCLGNGGWCMTPTHMQYRLYRYRDWIRHARLRGFYFDNAYPILCADLEHGCGYRLDDGRVQPTFTLFNMREFYKRLRTLILAEGIEPFVMNHATDTFMPAAYAFVDAMMDGETYRYHVPDDKPPVPAAPALDAEPAGADTAAEPLLETLAADEQAAEDAPAGDATPWRHYWSEAWPPEHFQVFGPPQHWGIMTVTMAHHKAPHAASFLGYLLLHDTEFYHGPIRAGALTQAGLDLSRPITFLPYWEAATQAVLRTEHPDVLLGGYRQDDMLLVVAFNRTRLPLRRLPVTVDLGGLGWRGPADARVGVIEFPKDAKDRAEALAAVREQVLAGDGAGGKPNADGCLIVPLNLEPHAFATATLLRLPQASPAPGE